MLSHLPPICWRTSVGLWNLFGNRLPAVDAETARELVAGEAVMLDVREATEWRAGHAPHAVHVPLGRIAEAPKRLRAGRQVVVVCRSGNRSRQATRRLRELGIDAVNLRGGMRAWQAAGGAVVDGRNRPGVVA
ncbi:rhodanese-like domain-containing protein [Kineosporiaceae bacterium SCSIO 59966]|nr:rhodanese-like domain-containing protein [Kineosporiaceae bacterium SCSIO 59966]